MVKPRKRKACGYSQRSQMGSIYKAMELATYEIIEDEGTYWGEIPQLQGVWANHSTLEGCRTELREALSDWIALRLSLGLSIPIIADIDLNQLTQQVPLI
mgnify:CR=1 FL=1